MESENYLRKILWIEKIVGVQWVRLADFQF